MTGDPNLGTDPRARRSITVRHVLPGKEATIFFDDPTADVVARGILLSVAIIAWVVLLVRIVGLRSFSKMNSFDFVMTIAMGSLTASAGQADEWPRFGQAMAAMVGLFLAQWLAARLRRASDLVNQAIQNTPIILMENGQFIDAALAATRVSRGDLYSKLRQANVTDLSRVRAVVLETTSDVSVLHGDDVDERLLEGVRRIDK